MNDILSKRNREFMTTKAQRRRVNALLRDGYDLAMTEQKDEDFQVTLYTDELPTQLTSANDRYFELESTLIDMNTLFGHIATSTSVHIDALESGYRISLLHEAPKVKAEVSE